MTVNFTNTPTFTFNTANLLPRTTKEEALDQAVTALGNLFDVFDESPSLRTLQRECWQTSEDHGFHDVGQTVGDRLMLIVSEAGEALEDFRDGHEPSETWYTGEDNTKPCGVPSEIADIMIRCMDFAESYGFDLQEIVEEKMAFNKTRPHLHGRTL